MRRRASPQLLAALPAALALALAGAPAARGATAAFAPCAAAEGFTCASVSVPLDRSGATPGTVSLSVERRLAGASPARSAVLALAGGPGQPALPYAAELAAAIAPALRTRDLLVFDQRGTGSSGPLGCAALNAPKSYGELASQCAAELGPARADYTTSATVADIEALRQAAGYEKLVLYGTSYGTKVALQYAARYPQNVEALLLDSVEAPEGPEPFALATFKAIGPALAEICARGACAGITASPLRDLARLVGELQLRPLRSAAFDGHGRRRGVSITAGDLLELLRAGDLNPALRAELPAAVRAALGGDASPLARLMALTAMQPAREPVPAAGVDQALFLATVCEEAPFPWSRAAPEATRAVEAEAALNALPRSDFYPFQPETALFNALILTCIAWPGGAGSPPPAAAPPNVPTLILSGGQDLRTPTADAERVARAIPDAQLLRVPYTGHSVLGSDLSGCAAAAVQAFFESLPVRSCAGARNRFPPPPVPPLRVTALPPTAGLPPPQGRTVSAVVGSLLDLRRTITALALDFGELPLGAPFGGLRGGDAVLGRAGVSLRRYSYVPGVTLSGLLPTSIVARNRGPAGTLTVGGAAAARGRLRVAAGGRLAGVLGGRSVHVTVAARVRLARAASVPGEAAVPPPPPPPLPLLARLR